MKKLLFGLSLAIGVTLTSFTVVSNETSRIEEVDCHYGQCQAIAKSTGMQCRHCVSNEGDWYCWQHK